MPPLSQCCWHPAGQLHPWPLAESLAQMYLISSLLIHGACREKFSGLAQTRSRADFVKPLLHFVRRKLLAVQKIGVQLRKIAGPPSWQTLKCFRTKNSKPVVYIAHAWRAVVLAVCQNLPGLKLDIAGVPLSLVAKDRHHPQHACGSEVPRDCSIVAQQIRVPVHHKK